jgi:hydrogenase expression/formation protein HypE
LQIFEDLIPINPTVMHACEMLGFDPLYVANEGKVIIILPEKHKEKALQVLHGQKYGESASYIGKVVPDHPGHVVLKTGFGTTRMVEVLSGEMLPRIC